MNLSELRELILVLDQTDISEIELESDGAKVSIRKGGKVSISNAPANPTVATSGSEEKTEETAAPAAAIQSSGDLVSVTAPMVGTFYRAPSPDADPFVKIGDFVEKGQTLCIVEAMKLMNEIEAEHAGEIVEIPVENAQPVEYGQKLFLIRKE